MIAALYVDPKGVYAGLPDVDLWDEKRDARKYAGPWPVVAHPPCSTWCQLASVNEARYGHPIGSDGGCFEAALDAVRTYGGVLEHPAYSLAWDEFELNRPPTAGGWIVADWFGGWTGGYTCHVAQRNYGHPARKETWLYAFGIDPPSLKWGRGPAPEAWVSWADSGNASALPRIGKKAAAATPIAFRDELIAMARS